MSNGKNFNQSAKKMKEIITLNSEAGYLPLDNWREEGAVEVQAWMSDLLGQFAQEWH